MSEGGWTGRTRLRRTPPAVRRREGLARLAITAGGLGTIGAVLALLVFLLWVIWPLFGGESVAPDPSTGRDATAVSISSPVAMGLEEHGHLAWVVDRSGTLRLYRFLDGAEVLHRDLFPEGPRPTAWSFPPGGEEFAVGFSDGTVRRGTLRFDSTWLTREEVQSVSPGTQEGDLLPHPGGVLLALASGQYRWIRLEVTLEPPQPAAAGAIHRLDLSLTTTGAALGILDEAGGLAVLRETTRQNLMTGEVTRTLRSLPLPPLPADGAAPHSLLLSGTGHQLYLLFENGRLIRYDTRPSTEGAPTNRAVAERTVISKEAHVTASAWALGKTTFLVADSSGALTAWFAAPKRGAAAADGIALVRAHVLRSSGPPITALAASPRSHLIAAGDQEGGVQVLQVTVENPVGSSRLERRLPVRALALGSREDALLALGDGVLERFTVAAAHADVTLRSLLSPLLYEGQTEPAQVWQATGGTNDFEPKLGLWPLVFGTLKATLYSILFAAPLAFLAAIYTSEFLALRIRAPLKSAIEMMAGLPSVVLGFLAGLVLAPFLEKVLPAALLLLVVLPFALLLGARLWQLGQDQTILRRPVGAVPIFAVALAAGVGAAALLGPLAERVLFAGDLIAWLNGGPGAGDVLPAAFFCLPLGALLAAVVSSLFFTPALRSLSQRWSARHCALADLSRLLISALMALGLALLLGFALSRLLPLRGGNLQALAFTQKNALVVGIAMGFAVIPIIYTLAEDALSSVPRVLREGSLGCGATAWQTTWRVVVPAAMSGLFSALMIGLGRAVGETMIVLMATGNTPIMEWNPFSGFRTLSATVATELPEAPRNSTHFRVLFLAALLLFLMTFVINSLAEVVRRSVRSRAAHL